MGSVVGGVCTRRREAEPIMLSCPQGRRAKECLFGNVARFFPKRDGLGRGTVPVNLKCGPRSLHVSSGALNGAAAACKFPAVRRGPDGGSLLHFHQSGGISNQPYGAGARRVHLGRLRESGTATYAAWWLSLWHR